jgi:two-component system catabolic regulation response regulator CreB
MPTVLVVDDEPGIRESLVYALGRDGFGTVEAGTIDEAEGRCGEADLIILDLMLPDGSGMDFLARLRNRSQVPVIVLTSREEVTDRVVGLELGADDYVVKPFSPREIVARVRAVLRRTGSKERELGKASEELRGPDELRLDADTRRAWVAEQELQLSKMEFELLMVFLQAPGRVFERGHLLQKVWGPDCVVGERTVDVHLKGLRKKIEQAGGDAEVLETVRGVGYRLREAE